MSISLLFPTGVTVETKKMSENTQHDLGLDIICGHIVKGSEEERYIREVMSEMTDSKEVAAYRIAIFDDIFTHQKMREDIAEILKKIRQQRDYGRLKRVHTDAPGVWDLVHRLEELREYITTVESLYTCLEDKSIQSKGLIELRDYVKLLYKEHGFRELKEDIGNLKVSLKNIKSITLGINLNDRFEASGVGLISINNESFTRSTLIKGFSDFITNKDMIKEGSEWDGNSKFYPITIASVPDGDTGSDITKNCDNVADFLLNKTIKNLKNVLSKYVAVTIEDIMKLIPEFTYYVRWTDYITTLMQRGYCFSRAEVSVDNTMHAEGIYNAKLACLDVPSKTIVTNDLDFSDDKCAYILTGANRGGKTTITQAVGLLYVLAAGGIYVPCKKFIFAPVDCIYTHFPVDEERTVDLGRLGEECKRFHELFIQATQSSLVLLNESFSTTSFEEGYYIARDSVRAILDKGIRTIYNTHMHKLGYDVEEINQTSKVAKAVSLVMKTDGHERSYKVEIAPPEGTSLARDIAEKYGVTYEMLMKQSIIQEE